MMTEFSFLQINDRIANLNILAEPEVKTFALFICHTGVFVVIL